MPRQTVAQGRFPGAAQSDQRNAPLAGLTVGRREMRVEQCPRRAEPVRRQAAQKLDDPPQFRRFGGLAADQLGKRQVERVADPAQQLDREIAFAAFELREITLRKSGIARQYAAGHAAAGAFFAHPLAEAAQIIVPLGGGVRKAASAG